MKDWTQGYRQGYNMALEIAASVAEEYFGKEKK